MKALIGSTVTPLLKRWSGALQPAPATFQAISIQDLNILFRVTPFDIMLLHSVLADTQTVADIVQQQPGIRILVLSDRPNEKEGIRYLLVGSVGCANSYINKQRLVEAVKAIITGLQSRTGNKSVREKSKTKSALQNLSNREYQIAALVSEGLSNPEDI